MAVIARETAEALDRVLSFFAIDACNRYLFGRAAERCGNESFSAVVEALDAAIKDDPRRGVHARIRARIELEQQLARSNERVAK